LRVEPRAGDVETMAREYAQLREGYLKLLEEWHAADTASRIARDPAPRFELLQAAQVPVRPYFPNRVLLALVGLAAGLTLGLLTAVVAEARDPTVKGPEDLAEILPQPLLAAIPLVRTRRAPRKDEQRPA
jgi:polysaccharide biosynthesis transport protein